MENYDWKEELALKFRNLKIDRNLITEAIKSTVSTIENNFSSYDINKKVTSDISNISLYHSDIENYRRIDVTVKEDSKLVTFVVFSNCVQPNVSLPSFITLSTDKGRYIIEYVNCKIQNKCLYKIDKNTMNFTLWLSNEPNENDIYPVKKDIISYLNSAKPQAF